MRCRPPFEDEGDYDHATGKRYFNSHVQMVPHRPQGGEKPARLGSVRVKGVELGKQREFHFDYAFGPKVRDGNR